MPDKPSTDTSDASKEPSTTETRVQNVTERVSKLETAVFGDETIQHKGLRDRHTKLENEVEELKKGNIKKLLTWVKGNTLMLLLILATLVAGSFVFFK